MKKGYLLGVFAVLSLLMVSCKKTEIGTLSSFSIKATPDTNSIALDWEDVTSSLANEAVTYTISLNGNIKEKNLTKSEYTITNLESKTQYKVTVSAVGPTSIRSKSADVTTK